MDLNGIFSIKINGSIVYINDSVNKNKNSSSKNEALKLKEDKLR
ncbi:hypothetical protein BD780_000201 [Clostridium tetanomorphum]|nr:hypothetical protein [Clostridium tetanomorphum]MBP1864493.1 hypothetical protein [Clostridium tetanomorphum]NRS82976.1 hypothetical protein [Clostridium tetanomorphum]NRZ98928.1 hypothetical protein [Clostridium tetanomorphum]SQC01014.1 Uncharacterised protein [Clostridium tetanomorphum]